MFICRVITIAHTLPKSTIAKIFLKRDFLKCYYSRLLLYEFRPCALKTLQATRTKEPQTDKQTNKLRENMCHTRIHSLHLTRYILYTIFN